MFLKNFFIIESLVLGWVEGWKGGGVAEAFELTLLLKNTFVFKFAVTSFCFRPCHPSTLPPPLPLQTKNPRQKPRAYFCLTIDYSMILITEPEPTVLPPSRIENFWPCSIAIGAMSSMFISTLSPGIHISTPSGRVITPVTSVVVK